MSKTDKSSKPGNAADHEAATDKDAKPGWTRGLKKLYDSVVEEPLPDSFEDLLKKLDGGKDG